MHFFCCSGYGSQAVSSNTLSSDDSMSFRSISVDGTPDTEVAIIPKIISEVSSVTGGGGDRGSVTVAAAGGGGGGHQPVTTSCDLLSPPDISLTSISPGEETDTTVTVETTPSSANITPSQSWSTMPAPASNVVSSKTTAYGVSFTKIHSPRSHHKILREKKNGAGASGTKPSLNPNRASYPGSLTSDQPQSLVMSTTSSSSTSSSGERLSTVGTDGKVILFCVSAAPILHGLSF